MEKRMFLGLFMDRLTNQLEDMQNDPDREDYYANMGNYCAMLWLRFSEFKENGQTCSETQTSQCLDGKAIK